jgi:starvation-inducible DNA-binding protein
MEELINILKSLLSDTVALKFKAHGYHWNIEGDDFPQYHEKFEEIYEDMDGAIDPFAENVRKLGDYAPFKLSRFVELTTVPESSVSSDPMDMASDLLASIQGVTAKIQDAFDIATSSREQGIANFLADRQDMHRKWEWQLRASVKPEAPGAE